MHPLFPTLAATAQILFITGVQSQSSYNQIYTSFLDAQCNTPVKSVSVNGNNSTDVYDTFQTPGIPDASFWTNPVFENQSTAASGSGIDIWWKVAEQDPGCGVALMVGYSQQTYGHMDFVAPSGNVIMFANTPGCYYSQIPRAATPEGNPFGRRGLSARASSLDLTTCNINTAGGGYPSAGQQTLVANPQTCTGGSCSFAVAHGITVSTSLSTSQETTITNTVGGSLNIQTRENFIVESSVNVGVTYSFAKAVAKSTGTDITNGTSVTVTNTLGQEPGTTAFITFTPTYTCWNTNVDCGTPNTGSFDFCQPALGPDGGLQGDYTVVYI